MAIFALICFNNLSAQVSKISGTWVNADIYNAVQQDTSSINLNDITPRCVYVNSSNKITIEYRFEQKSKTAQVLGVSKRGDSLFFYALRSNFAVVNDSIMLLFNYRRNITFKKIDKKSVVGNGVQQLLKNHFWGSIKKWKVVNFRNGIATDTILATIGSSEIHGNGDSIICRHYEFIGDKGNYINRESLFKMVTFGINKSDMADSVQVFEIKKSNLIVCLYKKGELSYKFIPIE
jgi:hypothetical protein